jgi:hypothetical protein
MDGIWRDVSNLVKPHRGQASAEICKLRDCQLIPLWAQLLAVSLRKVVGREDDIDGALAPDHLLSRLRQVTICPNDNLAVVNRFYFMTTQAATPWSRLTVVQQHCHGRSQLADLVQSAASRPACIHHMQPLDMSSRWPGAGRRPP